ncbi:MAG TPA: hypothetical protein VFV92_12610 [Candidatus Bathyarchaeia archaeon]|nr:hypothetical protein [Candidatus Bathyarchaeia archaeon]
MRDYDPLLYIGYQQKELERITRLLYTTLLTLRRLKEAGILSVQEYVEIRLVVLSKLHALEMVGEEEVEKMVEEDEQRNTATPTELDQGGSPQSDSPLAKLSYQRGCQEKNSPPTPHGDMDVVACIQSRLSPGGDLVLATSIARPTQLMVPTREFHDAMVLDAFGSGSCASIRYGWLKCQP